MALRLWFLGLALGCVWASASQAAWTEAKTRHFIIYSEQSPETLRGFAERLERFDSAVRRILKMKDPPLTDGGKVTIYVLRNSGAVQKLSGSNNSNVLGFYQPRASGSVAFVSSTVDAYRMSVDHIFQHEYVHHLMLNDLSTPLAAWMIEGFAEFFGTAVVEKDGKVTVGYAPQVRADTILADLGLNAEKLLTGVEPRTDEEQDSLYGKGWLLTHYLTFNEARRGQVARYIDGLGRGEAPLVAARSAFGDLRTLDRELDRYARSSRFKGMRVTPGAAPVVALRPLSPAESAIMSVRLTSERGVNQQTAAPLAVRARRIAVQHPSDPFVQGVLAEAEFDAGNYREALAAADRALAAAPQNVQALIYRGRALMRLAETKDATGDWAEARRSFVRANKADVENAEPLYLYYQSFVRAGDRPTAAAVKGLLYAQVLAPQDSGLRLTAIRQALVDKDVAQAKDLFLPLMFSPHVPQADRKTFLEVMDRIRAGDAPGALEKLDSPTKPTPASPSTSQGGQGIARPSTLPLGE